MPLKDPWVLKRVFLFLASAPILECSPTKASLFVTNPSPWFQTLPPTPGSWGISSHSAASCHGRKPLWHGQNSSRCLVLAQGRALYPIRLGLLQERGVLETPCFQQGRAMQTVVLGVNTQLCPTLCAPWTAARQSPLSVEFSRREYWSGLPFPPPGDLPDPGIDPESLASPALAGGFFSTGATWEAACNSGHPVNVDWMNEGSPLSRRWTASRFLSAQNETDQLFNFSGASPLHFFSCNHQPVLCLSLSGQGEVTQENRCSLNWTLHRK